MMRVKEFINDVACDGEHVLYTTSFTDGWSGEIELEMVGDYIVCDYSWNPKTQTWVLGIAPLEIATPYLKLCDGEQSDSDLMGDTVGNWIADNPEVKVKFFDDRTYEQLPPGNYEQCIAKRVVWCPADDTFRIFI